MDYSIIVPLYNEEKNVKLLNKELVHSIIELKKAKENEFQLIFVSAELQNYLRHILPLRSYCFS